jgi:hypothetical protein
MGGGRGKQEEKEEPIVLIGVKLAKKTSKEQRDLQKKLTVT